MEHTGEIIALLSAVSCTATALYASEASGRLGTMTVNVIRLLLASVFLAAVLWITTGSPYPVHTDRNTWLYLSLSAIVGYVFGDYCLYNSYLVIGPKTGQLFMTLAPPIAAIAGCIGFLLIMTVQKELGDMKKAAKDSKGLKYAALTTLFGPVIGVSLSLMAVRYTETGIASTLMALTPVLIIIPYSIIYRKKITFKEVAGVLVSMTGVAMFFML